ncbi:hypothetical protein SDC9_46007 [bioreactor metagenome]|jgi:hypothetical protein|uniref:Uncharacterized protein n=1 Tax=bioreactor metagenome TaxID=1076179 RepID=A0A644W8G4_9ZZZZ|nr:hypothetical protein [Paludibacter sp.]
MKKTILLLVLNLIAIGMFAQTVISNGESIGTGWWPAGSAGEVGVWNNPLKDGVNNTDKAMTVWINNGDLIYTGGGIGGLNVDMSTYNTISVMVYKQIAGMVRLEIQDATGNKFCFASYTSPGNWQNLKFPIPADFVGPLTALLVAPHFENYTENPIPDGEAHRMWWDEVVAFNDTTTGISNPYVDAKAEIVKTIIYTMNGSQIGVFGEKELIPFKKMSNGLYVVQEFDDLGRIYVSKILIDN